MTSNRPRNSAQCVVLDKQLRVEVNQIRQRLFGFINSRIASRKKFIGHRPSSPFEVSKNGGDGEGNIQRGQDSNMVRLWGNETIQNSCNWLKAVFVLVDSVGSRWISNIVDGISHCFDCLSCNLDGIAQRQNPAGECRFLRGGSGGDLASSLQFTLASVLHLNNPKGADDCRNGTNRLHPSSGITRLQALAINRARDSGYQKKTDRSAEEPNPPILSCDFYHGAILA